MKKKKTTTIVLIAVLVIFALGFTLSYLIDWPIDRSESKGDIAKSARFSRKAVADANSSNIQELLVNDESFKKNMVAAFVVMQSRAKEFNALVNMSVDVAGDKPSFDKILAEMKAAKPMLDNVNSSMNAAGSDLSAVLGGEDRKDLAQNTNNATLAYATLQKQNNLADKFIQATDEYLKMSSGDEDRLKLVRDQWLEYQIVTSALNKDTEAQKKLEEKGYLLSSEQAALTLKELGGPDLNLLFETNLLDGLLLGEMPGSRHVCIRYEDLGNMMAEINQDGVMAEIGNKNLMAESNKDDLLSELNGPGRLLAEFGQKTLMGFEGGKLLLEEFGRSIQSIGYINQDGRALGEYTSPSLLSAFDLGTVILQLETGGVNLNEFTSGGFGQ